MEEEPSNIFDAAAKQAGEKKKGKDLRSSQKPQKKGPPPKDEEVNSMFKRIDTLQKDLEKKLEDLYEKGGISHKELETYLINPDNFTKEEWQRVHKNRDRFLNLIWGGIGKEKKKAQAVKKEKKAAKKRKRKTLGSRKGWIRMD